MNACLNVVFVIQLIDHFVILAIFGKGDDFSSVSIPNTSNSALVKQKISAISSPALRAAA